MLRRPKGVAPTKASIKFRSFRFEILKPERSSSSSSSSSAAAAYHRRTSETSSEAALRVFFRRIRSGLFRTRFSQYTRVFQIFDSSQLINFHSCLIIGIFTMADFNLCSNDSSEVFESQPPLRPRRPLGSPIFIWLNQVGMFRISSF